MSENDPIIPGCPSIFPRELPGGFDGVEPGGDSAEDLRKAANLLSTAAKLMEGK